MRILQLNLNHRKVAEDLLKQKVKALDVDIAILAEQHRSLDN